MKIVEYSKGSITEVENVFKVVESGAQGPAGTTDHFLLENIGTNTHVQIDSHIADAANPHSVTKTQVGLGSVTDDSQLKRSAGDFQAFTQKINVDGTESLIAEDGSDGENKKRITVAGIYTYFKSLFDLIYQALFNTQNLGTISSAKTINATSFSTITGDFTASFAATFEGFTASRKSVLLHLVVSGGGAPTITIAGYTFTFMTTLNLTTMADGTYQVVVNNPKTDTTAFVYVKLAP